MPWYTVKMSYGTADKKYKREYQKHDHVASVQFSRDARQHFWERLRPQPNINHIRESGFESEQPEPSDATNI